ncbi:hypothetical protein ACFQL0_06480 [Haloplanus litoreus]|uniref:hypothetical protein n=1 Tax=Haloplanus litoreus TaxID=767515 RepID=UPI00361C15A5
MPSDRRAFLASLGTAAAGMAGCLGAPDESNGSPTATATTTATPTPVPPGR